MDHTFIIIKRGCREWVNKLWSDMSVHAAAPETHARVYDLSFFERIPLVMPVLEKLLRHRGGYWSLAQVKNLPPTEALPDRYLNRKRIFFFGWLFRNPVGFEKYRKELLEKFGPNKKQLAEIEKKISPYADKKLIGIYVRTKPFRFFPNGEFLISRERTMQIVEEYLRENNLTQEQVALIETNDRDNEQTTFHLLSHCDVVIGTNSTYCNLAAWFGNISHIVTLRESIDWDYYKDKKGFFENKYATLAYGGEHS